MLYHKMGWAGLVKIIPAKMFKAYFPIALEEGIVPLPNLRLIWIRPLKKAFEVFFKFF